MSLSSTDLTPESATSPEQTPFAGLRNVRSVLLCGASVRSLAESAISAGLRPLCVDFFADQDLTELLAGGKGRFVGRIKSFADLPSVIRSVRSTIPMLWAGGLENHTDVLRKIAQRRPVIGADPDVIDRLRNPQQLHDWLTSAGLRMPRLATDATATAECQWLRKPIASSGGLGIRAVTNSSLAQSPSTLVPKSENYLQEFIDGVPMSSIFCSDHRGLQLIGTSLQLIGWPSLGASHFLFCGNVGPVEPGELINQQLHTAATAVVEQTGLVGVFGIDFILREGQVWVLEVNPRITASHVLYEPSSPDSGRLNLTQMQLNAFSWKSARHYGPPSSQRSLACGSTAVAARLILWANSIFATSHDLKAQLGALDCMIVADRPPAETSISAGSPICSICVSADNLWKLVDLIGSGTMDDSRHSDPVRWEMIAQQLSVLLSRFELHKTC